MEENNSHPIIVRGPDNVIQIPKRLRDIDGIKDITDKTRGRFSTQSFTLEEIGTLLGKSKPMDASHIPSLDLIETIRGQHTILIQLLKNKRWKILCLLDMVQAGWSALERNIEGQMGVFHTGTRLSLGHIPEQYLIPDNQYVAIGNLIEQQRKQPDIIAWRDKHF